MNGSITLHPIEFLAIAALPLSSLSAMLKRLIRRRFGTRNGTDTKSTESQSNE